MALDDDDLKKIQDLITAGLKTYDTQVQAHVTTALEPLKGELKTLKADKAPDDDGDSKDKGKDKPRTKDSDQEDPEVARLRKIVEDRERELEEQKAQTRQDALHSAARDALSKQGVAADRLPVAMAYLRDRLAYDGDKMGVQTTDKWGNQVIEPMDEALGTFLQSDEGKMFMPPANTDGTGTGPGPEGPAPTTAEGGFDWDAAAEGISIAPFKGAT